MAFRVLQTEIQFYNRLIYLYLKTNFKIDDVDFEKNEYICTFFSL